MRYHSPFETHSSSAFFQERCVEGSRVLVEGRLVSSTYERPNGNNKSKKAKTAKITSWSIRADVVRRLDRDEPGPGVQPSASDSSEADEAPEASSF
jgi:single-stranded DNA-binding protein